MLQVKGKKHRINEKTMGWILKNLRLNLKKATMGVVLFFLVSCNTGQVFFVSLSVAEKANQILPPLDKLILLKIKQNNLFTRRNQLIDKSNQLTIKINQDLERQNPLMLEAYQLREGGSNPQRYVDEINQINRETDQLRTKWKQKDQTDPLEQEIARLMKEIDHATEDVELLRIDAERLEEEFPEKFTSALQLVKETNPLRSQADRFIEENNTLVRHHDRIIDTIAQLNGEALSLYARPKKLSDLRSNFSKQEQLRREQASIISALKKTEKRD